MRKFITVFLTIFSTQSFSSNFLQVYQSSERLKEDIKVFGSGLIRLTTSSFKEACNDNAGIYEKRFSKDKISEIFKLAKQAVPQKKNDELEKDFSITYIEGEKIHFINTVDKNDELIDEIKLSLSFLKRNLAPVKAIQIKAKKISEKQIEVNLKNLGPEEFKIKFPPNFNQLFKVSGFNQRIKNGKKYKSKNGHRVILTLTKALQKSAIITMNTKVISRYFKTPHVRICTTL